MNKNYVIVSAVVCFMTLNYSFGQQNDLTTPEQIQQSLQNLPSVFRKNMGQWNADVLYRTSVSGACVSFLKNNISFAFQRQEKKNRPMEVPITNLNGEPQPDLDELLVWNLNFENTKSSTQIIAEQHQSSHVNYLIGDASNWKTNVPDFGIITYKNIYNQIDLRYYNKHQQLKYDYIIHAGADANDILMSCHGIKNLSVNNNGELMIETAWGILKEKKPYAYQIINNQIKDVAIAFNIVSEGKFGFKINSDYDKSVDLIIDPVILEWSTFVGGGGNGNGYIFDIKVDSAGYVYGTGYYNENFPVTPGVYDTTYNQGGACGFGGSFEDVFVIKLNPNATSIVWATYVGGNCAERGRGIAINKTGECFVTGWTKSTDFPKVNPIQLTLAGTDAIAFRLNSNGTGLIYSTFFGGAYNEWGEKIAINSNNEAYLTGATLDMGGVADFPVTLNAFQTTFGGGGWQSDAYVTKLNSNGSLNWSSYLGGPLWDWGYGIDVDINGNVYVTGKGQTGFPTTPGAFQTVNKGSDDIFVTEIDPAGVFKIYSTMIGGSVTTNGSCACESGNYIKVNAAGESYVTGNVRSSDMPTTPGVYDSTYNNGYYGDAFALKLNSSGSNLIYSTYIGGTTLDIGWGLDFDSTGNVFIAGYTDATDFPATTCAYDSTYNGSTDGDFFIAKLNNDASKLMYASFVGGNDQDYWEPKVCVMGSQCDERIVFCGTTHSQNFPTTQGVIQPIKLNGVNDQPCIFKMKPKIYPGFISPSTANCNTVVNFTDTTSVCGLWDDVFTTHHWQFSDGSTADGISVTHTFATAGVFTVTLVVGCPMDSITKQITINCNNAPVISIASSDTSFCEKRCLKFFDLSTNNPTSWQWYFPGAVPDTSTMQNPVNICFNNYGSYSVKLVACNSNACDSITFLNFINEYKTPVDTIIQSNDTLYSLPFATYQWYEVTSGIITGATSQYFAALQPGSYYCVVNDTIGCEANSNTITVVSVNEILSGNDLISIYPNPANGDVFLHLKNNGMAHMQLIDCTGRIVLEKEISGSTVIKPVLNQGLFFVKIIQNNFTTISKLIIYKK